MPQAVEAYINGKNFSEIDMVKRQIISLYEEDFKKMDASGRISALYHSIPAQLARDTRIILGRSMKVRIIMKWIFGFPREVR